MGLCSEECVCDTVSHPDLLNEKGVGLKQKV